MSDPTLIYKIGTAVFIALFLVELLCILSTSSAAEIEDVNPVAFDYFKFHVEHEGVSFVVTVLSLMGGAVNLTKMLSVHEIGMYLPMLTTGFALFAALLIHVLFLWIGHSVMEKYQENIRSMHGEV